jgi:hypothetical protein
MAFALKRRQPEEISIAAHIAKKAHASICFRRATVGSGSVAFEKTWGRAEM